MEKDTTVYLNVRTDRYHTSEDCAGARNDLGIMAGEFKTLRHGSMACNRCNARDLEKEHEHI